MRVPAKEQVQTKQYGKCSARAYGGVLFTSRAGGVRLKSTAARLLASSLKQRRATKGSHVSVINCSPVLPFFLEEMVRIEYQ